MCVIYILYLNHSLSLTKRIFTNNNYVVVIVALFRCIRFMDVRLGRLKLFNIFIIIRMLYERIGIKYNYSDAVVIATAILERIVC